MKKLKFIGFISEYNPEIANAIPYKSYFKGNAIEEMYRHKVLEYVKSAIPLAATMRGIKDLASGEFIGSDACCTDGKWVWPDYMMYYLEHKPDYMVEESFLQDLIDNNFTYDKSKLNEEKLNFLLSKQIYGWWFTFKTAYLPSMALIKFKLKKWFR